MAPASSESIATTLCPHFPSAIIDSIQLMGEGDFCKAYAVNQTWVFLFAKHAEASLSLERQALLLPRLGQAISVPIPRIEFSGREQETGWFYVGYRMLNGVNLTRDLFLALASKDQDRCICQVAEFIEQLHSFDVDMAFESRVPQWNYEVVYRNFLEMARDSVFRLLDQEVRAYWERMVEQYLGEPNNFAFRPALLHRDLSASHLLFDSAANRISGIIDFGGAVVGDPASDLVELYNSYGSSFVKSLLKHSSAMDQSKALEKVKFFLVVAIRSPAHLCRADE